MYDASPNAAHASSGQRDPFEQFLLAEYNNIAQAHFNTRNSVASFFKNYLLIVSLPLPIIALIVGKPEIISSDTPIQNEVSNMFGTILPYIFVVVSIVGVLVMLYISNLHLVAYSTQIVHRFRGKASTDSAQLRPGVPGLVVQLVGA